MSEASEAPSIDLAGRRVALVHDWLTGMRGGEKVLEQIAALFPDAPIYTLIHLEGRVSPALEAHPIHVSGLQRIPRIAKHYRLFLPAFPAAIEDFDLRDFDVVISSSHCVAKGVIPRPDALHICYCHTPMRYAWDQEHEYFPKRRGLVAELRAQALSALRMWDVASAPRVDRFVANSSWVARRIERYYGRDAEVVAPPVAVEAFDDDAPSDERSPRVLMVAALAPYKRIDVAITACQRLGIGLDVVGTGAKSEERRLARLAGDETRFHGRVSDDELQRLVRTAHAFVQPGLEDFGIAAVEALAACTPVVALGRGGVCDIVDDGVHGVLYQLGDSSPEDALTSAIDKSRQIRFNRLELRQRAQSFSNAIFRSRFVDVLARCLAEPESA